MTTNRTLEILVETYVGEVDVSLNGKPQEGGFTMYATYTQTGSTPDLGNIVDRDGTIHLDNAADYDAQKYNQNVDLVFTLDSPSKGTSSQGTPNVTVAWATQYGPGMTIEIPEGGSSSEMTVIQNPSTPNVIVVQDKDDDSNTYNYKPAVEIIREGKKNFYMSLDPQIVNREINK